MDTAKPKGEENNMDGILWGLLFAALAMILTKLLEKKQTETGKGPAAPNEDQEHRSDYQGHYQAKYLLTRNEWYEYKKLKQYATEKSLQICPKVRLLDIVEPRRGDPNYMSYMGRIKSKHVDFVICDQDLHIKGILELDDSSHDRADRKERDELVDGILKDVGYKVIHTRSITEETLKEL